ncbi:MAG: hypothetical protein HOJ35_08430 [Bdellovibrionales bacterium]|nr:hypothetical protein [Bdellovibrionales bacterium]
MKIMPILFLLLIVSCSTKPVSYGERRNSFKTPEWVNNSEANCSKQQICAVGSGSGYMNASSTARAEIGKIFETEVKSNQYVSTNSEGEEYFDSTLEEISEEILQGVIIKESYEDSKDGTIFALAALDKRMTAKLIRKKINELDEKISALYIEGTRASLNKILKIFKVRNKLNQRFHIVQGHFLKSKITTSQILEKKRVKAKNNILVKYSLSVPKSLHKELSLLIEKILLENDYQVVNSKSHFSLHGEITSNKLHMNVKGFQKYKLSFNITSKNKSGQKLGVLNFSQVKIGRSFEQASELFMNDLYSHLIENLVELKMD